MGLEQPPLEVSLFATQGTESVTNFHIVIPSLTLVCIFIFHIDSLGTFGVVIGFLVGLRLWLSVERG